MTDMPERQVRALFSEDTITVYEAYGTPIAGGAVSAQRFVPPFNIDRMTWIKPSFLWMMYRSGWASKPGQGRILAIEISRSGFEWALEHSCVSHYDTRASGTTHSQWLERLRTSPVRIQWDPERSLLLEPLGYRAIQIGLSGEAALRYVSDWTVTITDVTQKAHDVHALVATGDLTAARNQLPVDLAYPLPAHLQDIICAT